MKVTALPDTIDTLRFAAGPPRSPGLHVSEVIRPICKKLDPKRYMDGELPWNRFEAGFTFERLLEMAFVSRLTGIFRPGEIVCDGIYLTPDGIDPDDWVLEEYKFTWMSSAEAPEGSKFWAWLVQIMAYCYALGITRARLRAFFVNGDYKTKEPRFRCWNLEFTESELADNWQMILREAALMQQ